VINDRLKLHMRIRNFYQRQLYAIIKYYRLVF